MDLKIVNLILSSQMILISTSSLQSDWYTLQYTWQLGHMVWFSLTSTGVLVWFVSDSLQVYSSGY